MLFLLVSFFIFLRVLSVFLFFQSGRMQSFGVICDGSSLMLMLQLIVFRMSGQFLVFFGFVVILQRLSFMVVFILDLLMMRILLCRQFWVNCMNLIFFINFLSFGLIFLRVFFRYFCFFNIFLWLLVGEKFLRQLEFFLRINLDLI